MKSLYKYTTWACFIAGVSAGLLVYHSALWLNGQSVVSRKSLEQQQTLIAELQQENRELTEELFKPRVWSDSLSEGGDLPYDAHVDAQSMVASARKEALTAGKFLMVTFGANWCMDCRTLHQNLKSEDVAKYTRDLFQWPGISQTCNFGHAKRHYLESHESVNPHRIVPIGPAIDFDEPHGREQLTNGT